MSESTSLSQSSITLIDFVLDKNIESYEAFMLTIKAALTECIDDERASQVLGWVTKPEEMLSHMDFVNVVMGEFLSDEVYTKFYEYLIYFKILYTLV